MTWQVILAFIIGLLISITIKIEDKSDAYHRGFVDGLKHIQTDEEYKFPKGTMVLNKEQTDKLIRKNNQT